MTDLPTAPLGGRYRLDSLLGEGTFAVVYRGTDLMDDSVRAVKVLKAVMGKTQRARFMNEARVMQAISHPNVLQVHDVQTGDEPFIVMDLATGGNLTQRVRDRGPLSPEAALWSTIQLLSGLATVHAAGIIHRDIKPDNILYDAKHRLLLTDFGIVRWVASVDMHLTRIGATMGTYGYAAPEQWNDATSVTPSSDLYAVASVLYFMLTGKTPPDLSRLAFDDPAWSTVPPIFLPVLFQATRKDPAARPSTPGSFVRILLGAVQILHGSVPRLPEVYDPDRYPEAKRA